jgi:predicted O-methyltransferase YrrM
MEKLKRAIVKTPILGQVIFVVFRTKIAIGYFCRPLSNIVKWLLKSKETTNFTYDLEETNKRYLASLIADISNIQFSVAMAYITEIEDDEELRIHIADSTEKSDLAFIADNEVRFGRRIGWYALTRALKPKTVIETGVDKGLGSCVLASALKRNKEEGHEGRYFGTDINPKAGYLLSGDYANYGCILYGDSIESLKKFDGIIDLFINDSDHSAEYEAEEYKTIVNKLSEHAIILGDNSHCTDKLLEFSLETNRHFVFFQEKPLDHWYPGAGIGISFKR